MLMCFSFVQAQDLDDIIAKHIEARGGAGNWAAVDNMKITGRFTAFSVEKEWMAIKTKEGQYYSRLHLDKFPVEEAFDGAHGWTIDPWFDITYPRLLTKSEENVFFQKSELATPFFNYKEKGLELELIGKQDLEGVEVFAIKLTRPNGKIETWYLDAKTYLEYKRASDWVDFSYPAPAESYFEDFREVNGLIIPFYEEKSFYQRNRVLVIEHIEFNVEVDEELFEMPKSKEILALDFMVGNWDVAVELWHPRRNSWYEAGTTDSEIEYEANNMLEEEIVYPINMTMPMNIYYSFHATAQQYRVSVYNDFNSEMEIFVGQMNDSALIVENTKVTYGMPTEELSFGKMQIIFGDSKDEFVVELTNSTDQGVSWQAMARLTYTRKAE